MLALAFLDPYCALVSADATGVVTLWPVRPAFERSLPAVRWRVTHERCSGAPSEDTSVLPEEPPPHRRIVPPSGRDVALRHSRLHEIVAISPSATRPRGRPGALVDADADAGVALGASGGSAAPSWPKAAEAPAAGSAGVSTPVAAAAGGGGSSPHREHWSSSGGPDTPAPPSAASRFGGGRRSDAALSFPPMSLVAPGAVGKPAAVTCLAVVVIPAEAAATAGAAGNGPGGRRPHGRGRRGGAVGDGGDELVAPGGRVLVFCGTELGQVIAFDLTPLLTRLEFTPLQLRYRIVSTGSYTAKRTVRRDREAHVPHDEEAKHREALVERARVHAQRRRASAVSGHRSPAQAHSQLRQRALPPAMAAAAAAAEAKLLHLGGREIGRAHV